MTPGPLVIDTSVAVKWFLNEPHTAEALAIQRAVQHGTFHGLAPDLIYAEFANTIWKHVRQGRVDVHDGESIIAACLRLPIEAVPSHALLLPAFRIACAAGVSMCDALFLSLSEEVKGDMVTADAQLYESGQDRFPRLRLLGGRNSFRNESD
jgi:predicted nucleic acid-binding protein